MANARLFQFRYSHERDLVDVMLKVSIGAAGAPTIVNGKGVTSITRNSTGKYTIVLKDNYNVLMAAQVQTICPAPGPAAPQASITSETVTTTRTVVLQMASATAAGDTTLVAKDPASGDVLMIHLTMRNAST
jgi:hypothetical protein